MFIVKFEGKPCHPQLGGQGLARFGLAHLLEKEVIFPAGPYLGRFLSVREHFAHTRFEGLRCEP